MIEKINEATFISSIAKGYSLVVFSASWCPDCRHIEPMLDVLEGEFCDKVRFYKVSFDEEMGLKDMLHIRKIPTLIFYKDGTEQGERLIEPRNIEHIRAALKNLCLIES